MDDYHNLIICSFSIFCNHIPLSDSQIGVKFASDGRHEYDSDLRIGGQETLPWISFGVALRCMLLAGVMMILRRQWRSVITVDHTHP